MFGSVLGPAALTRARNTATVPLRRLTARSGDVLIIAVAVAVDILIWGGSQQLRFGGQAPIWIVPLLDVAIFATLVERRRYPVEVFALQWVYSLAGLVFEGYGPIVGVLIALHTVASRRPLPVAGSALALCLVPQVIDSATEAAHRTHRETAFATSLTLILIMYVILFTVVWGLGRLSFAADQRSSKLLEQREAAAQEAIRAERRRLARELHDIVAHAVTAMMLQTSTASMMIGVQDDRARQSLDSVQHLGAQAMQELHRLLLLLRADTPDEEPSESHGPQPGIDDITSLIDIARASGVDVKMDVEGTATPLDRSVQLATYRVVQESLTNAIKHASGGQASVSLRWGDQLTVQVNSSTKGRPIGNRRTVEALSSGHGLIGLAERVALIGGTFASGRTGPEFIVTATLPLNARANHLAIDNLPANH